jgi:CHAT domain-containing protein
LLRIGEYCHTFLARVLAQQGRLGEAEALLREQLERMLKRTGRESLQMAEALQTLARLYAMQGRFVDSEWLAGEAVRVGVSSGVEPRSYLARISRSAYLEALFARGKYGELVGRVEEWAVPAEDRHKFGSVYVLSLVRAGKGADALSIAQSSLQREEAAYGPQHTQTAEARGALASALRAAGRKEEALKEFRTSLAALLASRGSTQNDEGASLSKVLLSVLVEEYLGLLTELQAPEFAARFAPQALIAEGFLAADLARAGSVQQALAQSAARASSEPALAEAVRREQDLGRELNGLYKYLAEQLSAPAAQQLPKVIADMRARIATIAAEQAKLAADIKQRFPAYANLIAPKPPSIDEARAALREGEALVSMFSGDLATYVWVVPKAGNPVMHAVAMDRAALSKEVEAVRRTVDPFARGLTEVPPFAEAAAWNLYSKLLKPVESAFVGARHLVVVANGAMASLSLAMLPTAAPGQETQEPVWFASNRKTPWLLRKHAVTQVPTVNSLVTLRALPARAERSLSFFGVGDPWFNREHAAQAAQPEAPATMLAARGARFALRSPGRLDQVDSAQLAQLARLPDTAEEIREVAAILGAAASPEVLLGAQANEAEVKKRDLRGKRVVMFATHGLMPGELDGLNQPALALSSPAVAGGEGDGLLTAEEVLGLKLDADWVVLSACNTAGGAAEGAEALSGLGRAFFYAGTRSLLVSNWPVETVSARLITTGVFAAQKADPTLSRAEALRKTMLDLIDRGEAKDAGGLPTYSYAHPLFWAPFTLVGDGS